MILAAAAGDLTSCGTDARSLFEEISAKNRLNEFPSRFERDDLLLLAVRNYGQHVPLPRDSGDQHGIGHYVPVKSRAETRAIWVQRPRQSGEVLSHFMKAAERLGVAQYAREDMLSMAKWTVDSRSFHLSVTSNTK